MDKEILYQDRSSSEIQTHIAGFDSNDTKWPSDVESTFFRETWKGSCGISNTVPTPPTLFWCTRFPDMSVASANVVTKYSPETLRTNIMA